MADPIATQAPPAVSPDRSVQPVALSPEHAQMRAIDRIEDALTRIDAATRKRADALARMEQRHDVLRLRMTEAVATLDTILAATEAAADAPADAPADADADADAIEGDA